MDIRNLISSQKLRHRILSILSFLPDSIMLPLQYYILLHRWPNMKNPKRFTEWIQIYKMKYRNPTMLKCVDKYEVREFVKENGLENHLNNLYQVCSFADQINFDKLPLKFVIKTTNGGNGDNIVIVKNKNNLNIEEVISKINSWLNKNYSNTSREWAYTQASENPRIIVEEFLEDKNSSLTDYKFYCYNGKFRFLDVHTGRYETHMRALFNSELQFLSYVKGNYQTASSAPNLPANIFKMIEVAEYLSSDFPFVRVDLYNVDGRIIFGELTFYPASGYSPYNPDDFDFELGKFFPQQNEEIWTKYKSK